MWDDYDQNKGYEILGELIKTRKEKRKRKSSGSFCGPSSGPCGITLETAFVSKCLSLFLHSSRRITSAA